MQRFFIGCLACCAVLLDSFGLARLHAAPPAKSADSQSAAPQIRPVYFEYVPFDWISEIPGIRQRYADSLRSALQVGLDKAQAGSTRTDILRLTSGDFTRLK